MNTAQPTPSVVTINGQEYRYSRRWAGQRLLPDDGYLAFDTETDVVDLKQAIPQLALASASAGDDCSCLIHPDDLGAFILAHRYLHWVFHNAAFDFWVVEQHLRQAGRHEALQVWWAIAESDHLHDSMLLDALLRLARNDSDPFNRNLAVVTKEYTGLEITKDDSYRLRYGEIIGQDWDMVDEGFFTYAIADAIVTRPTYLAIRKQAVQLVMEFMLHSRDILPGARQRHGILTEAIQVKKAIALAQITRNGMHVDLAVLRGMEARLREELYAAASAAQAIHKIYKTDPEGRFILSGKSRVPAFEDQDLRSYLAQIKAEIEQRQGITLDIPTTTAGISREADAWAEYAGQHPFLEHWSRAQELAKLLQFFDQLREQGSGPGDQAVPERQANYVVHPSYDVLKRTGRTSCSSPNIQQIPRAAGFREVFVAPPGYFLLATDYAFIELVTFAATALHRFGFSSMADVIKAGTDPHAHTAAMMLGVTYEEFRGWKTANKDRHNHARQAAKAVNFGVPGGLGPQGLVTSAKNTFGVTLTLEEAETRRNKLIKDIYPEMALYLADDGAAILARSLMAPIEEVRNELGNIPVSSISKILAGNPLRRDGKPYQGTFVSQVWASLAGLNRNPELTEALQSRTANPVLAAKVCHTGVATLTGRIRGLVGFTQARNTPFQGLASDGAALALFELIKQGFRVIGFVHDEILTLLPDEGGYVSEALVQQHKEIMCRKMEEVLVGDIPVSCEASLSDRWSKQAKLIVRDGKVIPWKADPV